MLSFEMKRETLNRRMKIANAIMHYIYTNIDTHIDIEDLSYELNISKFHMHRIFKEIFSMNIYESIKSIRLQKAASLLLTNKNSSISNIACQCGYSSQSSFIKAFKQRFDMSPKNWRNEGYIKYSDNILKQFDIQSKSEIDFDNISPEIVKMSAQKAFYIRNKGYSKNVKQTWQKLQTFCLTANLTEYEQVALLHDNPTLTSLDDCQYVACIVPKNKKDLENSRLPCFTIAEGIYAKFELKGEYGNMLKFINWVYHDWLINSEYETTTRPPFVVYHKNNFLSNDNCFDISFYFSIKF